MGRAVLALTQSTPASSLFSCHLLVQADAPLVCLLPSPSSCLLLPFKALHGGLLNHAECPGLGQAICALFLSLPPLGQSPLRRQSRNTAQGYWTC